MTLKIKKEFDLDILLQFGFKKFKSDVEYRDDNIIDKDIDTYEKHVWLKNNRYTYMVLADDRILGIYTDEINTSYDLDGTIYDLILAGIVEKVDD